MNAFSRMLLLVTFPCMNILQNSTELYTLYITEYSNQVVGHVGTGVTYVSLLFFIIEIRLTL